MRPKALLGILAVVAFFYLAWKVMPPYIAEYQFQQELETLSKNNEYSPADENAIRDQVRHTINDVGVPVNADSVVIQKGGGDCVIGVNYTVHVDALLHPFDLEFHPAARNGVRTDPVPANRTAP